MEALSIRDAAIEEFEEIVAITITAYQQFAPSLALGWLDGYHQNIRRVLNTETLPQRIVAVSSGAIIGSVVYYPAKTRQSGWPSIHLLAVTPEVRGAGVAKALVAECVRRAQQAGAATVGLHMMELRRIARAIHQLMGFVRAPEHDVQFGVNLMVLGYRLDLARRPTESVKG